MSERASGERNAWSQAAVDPLSKFRDFPAWHFAMLNDAERTATIEAAIASHNVAGKSVFEIGTGSGIIALLFAKYGAAEVLTCELNPNLVEAAQATIAATQFRDRIKIVHGSSREILESGLLSRKPDIIFTETVDCGVIGEGFFAIREDIRRAAGAHTVVLPYSIEQHGVVIESPSIRGLNDVGEVSGFDLSALNRFSTRHYFPVRAQLHPHRALARTGLVRTYRYLCNNSVPTSTVEITESGTAHGLLSWFTMNFGGHSVSTGPITASHWHQAFHPFETPIRVASGERRRLEVDDTGTAEVSSDVLRRTYAAQPADAGERLAASGVEMPLTE